MTSLNTALFYFFFQFSGQAAWLDALIVAMAEYVPYAIIMLIAYLIFRAWHAGKISLATGYVLALGSGIIGRVIVGIIRFFYHHPRPFVTLELKPLFIENSYSFPSGHAVFYFAVAAGVFAVNRKLGVILYILAILIGTARIAAGVHYPLDILGGAVLGIAVAYAVRHIKEFGIIPSVTLSINRK